MKTPQTDEKWADPIVVRTVLLLKNYYESMIEAATFLEFKECCGNWTGYVKMTAMYKEFQIIYIFYGQRLLTLLYCINVSLDLEKIDRPNRNYIESEREFISCVARQYITKCRRNYRVHN